MGRGVWNERAQTLEPQIAAAVLVGDEHTLSGQGSQWLGNPIGALQVKMDDVKVGAAEQAKKLSDIGGRPFCPASECTLTPSSSSASAKGPRPCMTATSTSKAVRSRWRSMSTRAVCAPPSRDGRSREGLESSRESVQKGLNICFILVPFAHEARGFLLGRSKLVALGKHLCGRLHEPFK